MDMTRHLPRWMNTAALERRGGVYDGTVDAVTEEPIRNRFTGETRLEPVITFRDGERMVPNIAQRRSLCEALGANTEEWIGVRLRIFLRQVDHLDRRTGEVRSRQERALMIVDAVRVPRPIAGVSTSDVCVDEIFDKDAAR